MKVYAPGKLILSGEHAVVHGAPALAMAVNRHAIATITHEPSPRVFLDLSDLSHRSHFSFAGLSDLKYRIKRKYHKFIRGEYTIRQVLHKPFELAQVALGVIADAIQAPLPHGVKIHVQSDIPIGCGMGSSAATIVSVMHALSHYVDASLPQDQLYQLALEAENLQHGHSSGLDLRLAMQGGCLYIHRQVIESRPVPTFPFYLINTGTPSSTTGECVKHTSTFLTSAALCDEFVAVTNAMDVALQQQSWQKMHAAIKANHQLLMQVEVVPQKVKEFIEKIETQNGAAKICGAGSITGDQAGVVLVLIEDQAILETLATQFNYQLIPISAEPRGVYAV